ncbi:MAG: hypothetical protein V4459_12515 [Pseudomonadota bacterium]
MTDHITIDITDAILTITMHRPEAMNAFTHLEKRAPTYPDKGSTHLPHFSPWLDDLTWRD